MTAAASNTPHGAPVEIPTLSSLGIPTAVFIRKLRKNSDWEGAPEKVVLFDMETPENSIYWVGNDSDLYLAVAAMNAKRSHADEDVALVYIEPEEFRKANLTPFQTDDEDRIFCESARKLHCGLLTKQQAERTSLEALVRELKGKNRPAIRIRRPQAKKIVAFLKPKGCQSYGENRTPQKVQCTYCGDYRPANPVAPRLLAPVEEPGSAGPTESSTYHAEASTAPQTAPLPPTAAESQIPAEKTDRLPPSPSSTQNANADVVSSILPGSPAAGGKEDTVPLWRRIATWVRRILRFVWAVVLRQ